MVAARLSSPRIKETLDDLLAGLHWTDLILTMKAPPLMEDLPDLGDRFRGALGRRLEGMGTPGSESWQLLFGTLFRAAGEEAIRPYALAAHRERDVILWRVRLFGFADLWAEEIMAAMCLAPGAGIALRRAGDQRVKIDIMSTSRAIIWWHDPLVESRRWRVATVTPLIIRRSRSALGSLDALHVSAARRLFAVARWCDLAPSRDLEERMAGDHWTATDETLLPLRWLRHSSNHPGGITNLGLAGSFRLDDLTAMGNRLLHSATLFHAGGGATAGFGVLRATVA